MSRNRNRIKSSSKKDAIPVPNDLKTNDPESDLDTALIQNERELDMLYEQQIKRKRVEKIEQNRQKAIRLTKRRQTMEKINKIDIF